MRFRRHRAGYSAIDAAGDIAADIADFGAVRFIADPDSLTFPDLVAIFRQAAGAAADFKARFETLNEIDLKNIARAFSRIVDDFHDELLMSPDRSALYDLYIDYMTDDTGYVMPDELLKYRSNEAYTREKRGEYTEGE